MASVGQRERTPARWRDDTLYRLLGSKLEALSATPELLLATESYGSRRLASSRLPGALVSEMTFTL